MSNFKHLRVVSVPANPCFMTILSRKGEGCPPASSGQDAHSRDLFLDISAISSCSK